MHNIKINGQTLKSGDNVVNKKEFHAPKQAIAFSFAETDKTVVSGKFKYSDNGPTYFMGPFKNYVRSEFGNFEPPPPLHAFIRF